MQPNNSNHNINSNSNNNNYNSKCLYRADFVSTASAVINKGSVK